MSNARSVASSYGSFVTLRGSLDKPFGMADARRLTEFIPTELSATIGLLTSISGRDREH